MESLAFSIDIPNIETLLMGIRDGSERRKWKEKEKHDLHDKKRREKGGKKEVDQRRNETMVEEEGEKKGRESQMNLNKQKKRDRKEKEKIAWQEDDRAWECGHVWETGSHVEGII